MTAGRPHDGVTIEARQRPAELGRNPVVVNAPRRQRDVLPGRALERRLDEHVSEPLAFTMATSQRRYSTRPES
jgi:hypothetical protein